MANFACLSSGIFLRFCVGGVTRNWPCPPVMIGVSWCDHLSFAISYLPHFTELEFLADCKLLFKELVHHSPNTLSGCRFASLRKEPIPTFRGLGTEESRAPSCEVHRDKRTGHCNNNLCVHYILLENTHKFDKPLLTKLDYELLPIHFSVGFYLI